MTLSPMEPNVSNISCIGVFSSLILGLWCKKYLKVSSVLFKRSSHKQAQHRRIHFPVKSQASEQSLISTARSIDEADRRSSGFWGCQVARYLARRVAPIVQGQVWVVRSNWDRWRPVGVSRIGVSGDKEPPILYS
jgi:hypothetical protein